MSLDLRPFKTLIKEHCGLSCEDHCEEKLARALKDRIAALALDPASYLARLRGDEDELQALESQLTINETYFFREPEQINLLVKRLAPRFLAARGGAAPVRILSAGCSSGEEPYSLAMALMEKYGTSVARLFSFAGGDLDSAVLDKARAARYTDFSFRGVPESMRRRYFVQTERSHVLNDEVRKLVDFHELNLLATPFPPALHGFDIIFFRNVSIYFDTPTRKIIQHNLASLLKDDGILVIGTAETLANDLGVLPLVEEDGLYYFVKGKHLLPPEAAPIETLHASPEVAAQAPVAADDGAHAISESPLHALLRHAQEILAKKDELHLATPAAMPAQAASAHGQLERARHLVNDRRYDEAMPALDAVLSGEPDNIEALLLKAHALINRKAFAAAEALAQRVLATDSWSIDALLLQGLAAKWQQHNADAIRHFKHAAYSRHECWPAHYYLADLYRDGGEAELAIRAYRIVIQLLSASKPDTGVKYVPFGLPTGEIRFLCEHQLGKLTDAKASAELR